MLHGGAIKQPVRANGHPTAARMGVGQPIKAIAKTARDTISARLSAEPATDSWKFATGSVAAYLRGRFGLVTLAEAKVLAALLQNVGRPMQLPELMRVTEFRSGSVKVAASKLRSSMRGLGIEYHLHGGSATGLMIDCSLDVLLDECEARNGEQPESKPAVAELSEHALRRELNLCRSAESRLLAKLVSQPGQPFTTAELTEATGCSAKSLKCFVSHLRTSLERNGAVGWIRTFRQSDLNSATKYAISASGYAALLRKVSPQLGEALEDLRRQNAAPAAYWSGPKRRAVSS